MPSTKKPYKPPAGHPWRAHNPKNRDKRSERDREEDNVPYHANPLRRRFSK